ncbi:hypothetical protein QWY85_20290 [Neolewinella lacunae]|uniref:Uncharacterized protein n=1 Tax=Neolewinella lacunae TaxID=1517758 RepID=A0A923TB27_9BACT|nr:hypothetical protein [Neolewinella lacunae]MBC6996793.1 hypothetical protein [Neolewinella lacunae]MDN3637021.1 hypothetical protein [Neolewinella lacunae]
MRQVKRLHTVITQLRNSIFSKALWGLMGLHLFNISVDAIDHLPQHFAEDLSYNDQESIVEFLVETILGFEDAFTEFDDHDAEDHNKKNNLKIGLWPLPIALETPLPPTIVVRKKTLTHYEACLTKGFLETAAPPPRF